MKKLFDIFKRLIIIQNDSMVRMVSTVAGEGTSLMCGEEKQVSKRPTFNHTRADGPYYPCPVCAAQMSKEQLLRVIVNLQDTIDYLESK